MKSISLTNSDKLTTIDDGDYERVSCYSWRIRERRNQKWVERIYWNRESKKTCHDILHRFILQAQKGQVVDHINGNGLDNRKSNLRFCTIAQNQQNRRKEGGTKNKYKGTWYNKERKKWGVRIEAFKKRHFLGYFNTEIEAAKAYNVGALKYHREFARLNDTVV